MCLWLSFVFKAFLCYNGCLCVCSYVSVFVGMAIFVCVFVFISPTSLSMCVCRDVTWWILNLNDAFSPDGKILSSLERTLFQSLYKKYTTIYMKISIHNWSAKRKSIDVLCLCVSMTVCLNIIKFGRSLNIFINKNYNSILLRAQAGSHDCVT